ncbi:ribonuclease H-like domain-containing protein [Tanacetum coccineum]
MLVPKPPNLNVVRSMWLFRHKYHVDGSLSRYKARLVANGRTQQVGIDCDDTFTLVVKPATIRAVLSLSLSRKWLVHQLSIKNAFLNVTTFQLQRSLYGLKQALRAWFQQFASYALRVGFSSSICDSSLFIYRHGIEEFEMPDLGALNYFLGIPVTRDSTSMFFSQRRYAMELLEWAHMVSCNPSRTPVDTESKLGPDRDLVSDPILHNSQTAAFTRILWYVCGTLNFGLQLFASSTGSLISYSDADWVGCPSTGRSSAEAEYQGVANDVAETAWIQNLLWELHTPLLSATLVYCYNVNAIYLSANPVQHQRTKHIEIDIHFVPDMVTKVQVRVLHVTSRYQYADIFTNGLPLALFEEFRTSLSVHSSPGLTAREC